MSKPKVTTADHKIGRKTAEKLAKASEGERKERFERMCANHIYTECQVRYSDFVAGAYLYAKMRRKE